MQRTSPWCFLTAFGVLFAFAGPSLAADETTARKSGDAWYADPMDWPNCAARNSTAFRVKRS